VKISNIVHVVTTE